MKFSIVVLISLFGMATLSKGDDELIARFLREYPAAAKRIEMRFSQTKGHSRLTSKKIQGNQITATIEELVNFASDHGFKKALIQRKIFSNDPKVNSDEYVYCTGENYSFRLTRLSGSEKYIVEGNSNSDSERSIYTSAFGKFANAHYSIFSKPLYQILKSPEFHLSSVDRVLEGGRDLIKVDYLLGDSDSPDSVTVVIDPNSDWMIRSSEIRPGFDPGSKVTFEIEFALSAGNLSPSRVLYRDKSGQSVCEFIDWTFNPTPEYEFSMPFFGLPDIVTKQGVSNGAFSYWIAGIAAVGVLLAIAIRSFPMAIKRDSNS